MNKTFRVVTIAYIIFLSMALGMGLFAGAVVAPVIFGSEKWLLSEVLSTYQEGQVMSEVFLRLSFVVNVTVLLIAIYEGYKYKKGERTSVGLIATFLVMATGMMFSGYYMPDIMQMQLAGEAMTQSVAFDNAHKGSELNFKIFTFSLLVLIVVNMKKACK